MVSLSTMWAQQERFDDIEAFRALVASFGYTSIEISHSTDERRLRQLLLKGAVPLSGLHAPAPFLRLPDGRGNSDLNLASSDEDVRRLAVEHHLRTIAFAIGAGLPYVVVHLGGVGDMTTEWERELKSLWAAGARDGERVEELRDLCRRHREAGYAAHMEAAHTSLRELTAAASASGIAIGLENRLQYHEFPHPDDAEALLAGYSNDVAGYWHDVGHAEVQHRLGLIDRGGWFPRLTTRTIGAHLHDVNGITDHRAPGNGDVDWGYIAAGLPATAHRVFEIDQHEPDDAVAAAPGYLRARRVIAQTV